jgi:hypothetical protein
VENKGLFFAITDSDWKRCLTLARERRLINKQKLKEFIKMQTSLHKVSVMVDINELIRGLDREDALALIKVIDLRYAEIDFTLNVVKMLISSLESDMTRDEIANELSF